MGTGVRVSSGFFVLAIFLFISRNGASLRSVVDNVVDSVWGGGNMNLRGLHHTRKSHAPQQSKAVGQCGGDGTVRALSREPTDRGVGPLVR